MRLLIFSLFLFIIVLPETKAQLDATYEDYSIISIANDLPDQRVTGMVKDPYGFLWLSTFNGLYRYDGIRYKSFRDMPDSENKIDFNQIKRIRLFEKKYLILEGERSLNILDITTEELIYQSPLSHVFIKSIPADEDVYFHFEDYVLKALLYKFVDGVLVPVPLSLPDGIRMDRACGNKGEFYFFDKSGRLWLTKILEKSTVLIDSTSFKGRKGLTFPFIYFDANQELWLMDNANSRYEGLYKLSASNKFIRVGDIDHLTTLIATEEAGIFWRYDMKSRYLLKWNLTTDVIDTILLLPQLIDNINAVEPDGYGNFYITYKINAGYSVMFVHLHNPGFKSFLRINGHENSLGQSVRALAEDGDGNILAGAVDGLYKWYPSTNKTEKIPVSVEDKDLTISNIWSIIPDSNGFWFTKEEGGLFHYDYSTGFAKSYLPDPQDNDRFLGMLRDEDGMIWIGTRGYVIWFDTHSETFEKLSTPSGKLLEASHYNWVRSKNDTYWLCSAMGLFEFDKSRKLIRRYGTDTKPYLLSNQVFDITEQGDVIWIATDHGLHRLENEKITVFTDDQGLANNSVVGLLTDDEGFLWIATFGGLSRMNTATEAIVNYYVEDGLPHNEFNRLSWLKASDGNMYFGTLNGVVHFDPALIDDESQHQQLVLTDIYTFSDAGEVVKKDVRTLRGLDNVIVIPANNKYFQVEFALLNFVHPEDNRYSYYLEGYDDTWRPLSNIPVVQYNNLPAGRYTLHIRGVNPSGQGSSNTLHLDIRVLQPFYSTVPFMVFAGIFLGGIVYLILHARVRNKLRLEQLRNKISVDLHDEVGGVLSGVAMQMDLLTTRSPDHLQPYMHRVAESSRNAALKMRDVIWSVDSSKDHFQDLLDRMKAYTLELLAPVNIHFKFDVQGIELQRKLNVEVRQNVYLIFKEAMNNVLRHSSAKHVVIQLKDQKKQLFMCIEDDGVGLPEKIVPGGQGLQNMQKRAKKIGGILEINNGSSGTEVKLTVTWK